MKTEKAAIRYEVGEITHLCGDYALVSLVYAYNCDAHCEDCREKCIVTTKTLRLENTLSARVGDRVLLSIPVRSGILFTILCLAIPCFLFMALYSFASFFLMRMWRLAIGLSLLAFVLLFAKITDIFLLKSGKCQINMVEVLHYPPKNDKMVS